MPPASPAPASRQPFRDMRSTRRLRTTAPGPAAAGQTPCPARHAQRAVLAAFAWTGQRPARSELERLARRPDVSLDAVLAELAETDVMAFDAGGETRAAYPFSPSARRSG